MAEYSQDVSEMVSPGGFQFGVQGFVWGEQRPKSITFFLDGTAKVSDQHGRPIRGAVLPDGKEVFFAQGSPEADKPPEARAYLARHAQVVQALAADNVRWEKLECTGWPQLPYEELKKLVLPNTPLEELRKIKDPVLRKDSIRLRKEQIGVLKESEATDDED